MDSVCQENVDKLLKEEMMKKEKIDLLTSTSLNKMWLNELNELKEKYLEFNKILETQDMGVVEKTKIKKIKIKKGK